MSVRRKRLGDFGEELAARYLAEKGYQILARKFRFARGEVDLVADKDGVLIFVEVKTATTGCMGQPKTWVNARKQQQIALVAQKYLSAHNIQDRPCRFDVIGITRNRDNFEIEHIENAFWLEAS